MSNTTLPLDPTAAPALDWNGVIGPHDPPAAADPLSAVIADVGGRPSIITAAALIADNPTLPPVVIDGLLREGEVATLVAAPKAGKTWLVHNLVLAIVHGCAWLGFRCMLGRVLLVDNELSPPVLAHRLAKVHEALYEDTVLGGVDTLTLRGSPEDVNDLEARLEAVEPGTYLLIVLDSLYRAWPAGTDENDNAAVGSVFVTLTRLAARMKAAIVCVHHLSKGTQADKSVTDLGSGAGAISRSVDCHLTLRRHEVDGCFVFDSVVRSFPPPAACVIEREQYAFAVRPDLDPEALYRPQRRKTAAEPSAPKPEPVHWTPQMFAQRFVTKSDMDAATIRVAADGEGVGSKRANDLLSAAVAGGFAAETILPSRGGGKRYSPPGALRLSFSSPQPPHTPPVLEGTGGAGRGKKRKKT
ncbi:MAG: AAA family ATPase [Verrucomicrobia bacterium]|nr:AAA family ATPase [Verrucomicrobiota bacterium]MBU4247223.1 AAA family ATPase [Verrucomicrobiota bacterium]MBU4291827.1 AAA family ATPase [Verrucomicrobiota bacterium]MBU4498212.1 AAA family ATPase [Verrucomicrobiota bacterium]MCG2678398.1 AAA family ATPase [Kiritimatiellia bacterium]